MAKNKNIETEPAEERDDNAGEKATINASDTKLVLARKLIANLRDELLMLENILISDSDPAELEDLVRRHQTPHGEVVSPAGEGRMIEGVFDGQNMVGSDGKQYIVPQNYASKSKLVEGDILKLTIQSNGGFLFKQIGPIERERVVGTLVRDENTQDWRVVADGKKYHVLPASISYFKGQPSDSAVVLIPKSAPSKWAAVENIIHQE